MVGVARIDPDPRNVLRIFQSDMLPCLAAIGRLVNSIAIRDIAAQAGLARTDIDHVWIRFRHGNRADRRDHALVGNRLPAYAAIGGAPHASGNAAEVVGEGTARNVTTTTM